MKYLSSFFSETQYFSNVINTFFCKIKKIMVLNEIFEVKKFKATRVMIVSKHAWP